MIYSPEELEWIRAELEKLGLTGQQPDEFVAYNLPDLATLERELIRAGADPDLAREGAEFIEGVTFRVSRPKTPAPEAAKLRALLQTIKTARQQFDGLNWYDQALLDQEGWDMATHLKDASELLELYLRVNPGGHREDAHARLLGHLRLWFDECDPPLPVSSNAGSPFLKIFALCIGQDEEPARTTLSRLLEKQG